MSLSKSQDLNGTLLTSWGEIPVEVESTGTATVSIHNQPQPPPPSGLAAGPIPPVNSIQNGFQPGPCIQSSGNHALQDYQMQLMLLEQQNKKRLMMARAEQDQLQMERTMSWGPYGTENTIIAEDRIPRAPLNPAYSSYYEYLCANSSNVESPEHRLLKDYMSACDGNVQKGAIHLVEISTTDSVSVRGFLPEDITGILRAVNEKPKDGVCIRLILISHNGLDGYIHRDLIDTLGLKHDIDPSFFVEHLGLMQLLPEQSLNSTTPPLPSEQNSHYRVHAPDGQTISAFMGNDGWSNVEEAKYMLSTIGIGPDDYRLEDDAVQTVVMLVWDDDESPPFIPDMRRTQKPKRSSVFNKGPDASPRDSEGLELVRKETLTHVYLSALLSLKEDDIVSIKQEPCLLLWKLNHLLLLQGSTLLDQAKTSTLKRTSSRLAPDVGKNNTAEDSDSAWFEALARSLDNLEDFVEHIKSPATPELRVAKWRCPRKPPPFDLRTQRRRSMYRSDSDFWADSVPLAVKIKDLRKRTKTYQLHQQLRARQKATRQAEVTQKLFWLAAVFLPVIALIGVFETAMNIFGVDVSAWNLSSMEIDLSELDKLVRLALCGITGYIIAVVFIGLVVPQLARITLSLFEVVKLGVLWAIPKAVSDRTAKYNKIDANIGDEKV